MREYLDQLTCHRMPGGLRVWLRSGRLPARRAQEVLLRLNEPQGADVEVLKQSARRRVLRVTDCIRGIPSAIVKGFPLTKFESRIKYRKYGLAEIINYHGATERGIPAPECYGYFEVRSLGFVKANGVIIEDLAGWRSLAELAGQDAAGPSDALASAIPLLKLLFETGTNHIDASPQNILQSSDGSGVKLIDWQYCSFVTPRSKTQLALQAAHFLNYAGLSAATRTGREWLQKLAAECLPANWSGGFCCAVDALQSQGKISGEDRLNLRVGPFAAEVLQSI